MIRTDLYCPGCDREWMDEVIPAGEYGICDCGTKRRWWARSAPATDVHGSLQEDQTGVLSDARGQNLTWTSSRERDKKMKDLYGVTPRGDKVNGARTEYAPIGKTNFHFGSLGNRSVKGRKNGRSTPAA